jgi:chromosome segregation ATPase
MVRCCAVAKALEQLDAARGEAATAAAARDRLEQECARLQQSSDSAHATSDRLHAQLEAVTAKLEQQSAATTCAVTQECERHLAAERALQQQVQQLASDLAVAQVR